MEKEIHLMILEYTTVEGNETIKLPLSGKSLNAQVDWGDGSPIQIIRNKYPTHEYAKSGVYEVMISGIVPRINSFDLSIPEREYLTRIKSWGKLTGLISMNHAFCDCKNLRGELPNDDYGCFENVIDFSYCFQSCTGLTGSIPENLFSNCPDVIDFDFCFLDCSGLTGSIPEELFANCPNVINFSGCFDGCTILSNNSVKLTSTTPVDVMKNDGCVEYGKCEICGKEAPLTRTNYYYYVGNECECCGTKDNTHFVIQRHCYSCKPKPPETIKVTLKADNSRFRQRLETLINNFSKENGSNTPDYISANYLLGCLNNFDTCVNARDKYYHFKTK